jgi:hypothetical protein
MTATTYKPGEKVTVFKYGAHYAATVTAVGRTTVTVTFRMKNGRTKTIKIAGYDVPHLIKPADAARPRTKLCNICRVVRVPVGVHACELCD